MPDPRQARYRNRTDKVFLHIKVTSASNIEDNNYRSKYRSQMEHEQGEVVNNRIYVGGLGDCIRERDLFHFFSKFGSVQHVGIITTGGHTKGYGFVTFHSIEVVGRILSYPDRDNLVLKGRKLFVGAARQRSSQMASLGGRGQVHDLHGGDEHGGRGCRGKRSSSLAGH